MIYTNRNAKGAKVYDVQAGQEVLRVASVDHERGVLTILHHPYRLNARRDEVQSYELRFDRIYAIAGEEPRPVLFHCYGRQP